MKLLQILILTILWAFSLTASEGEVLSQDRFTADEEVSRLWIEGSSNVNTFDCIAHEYGGEAVVYQNDGDNSGQQVTMELEIIVDGFDCGKRRMNSDMKKALKADSYPKITFSYKNAESVSSSGSDDLNQFIVKGELTVAGVTREISFLSEGELLESGRMRASGSKKIFMTDYGIEPPTGLLGLIKADDELIVHFDLTAKRI